MNQRGKEMENILRNTKDKIRISNKLLSIRERQYKSEEAILPKFKFNN